jgi:flagellar biosynthetic protein FliO
LELELFRWLRLKSVLRVCASFLWFGSWLRAEDGMEEKMERIRRAVDSGTGMQTGAPASESFWMLFLQMTLGLVLVSGLLIGILYLVKKLQGSKVTRNSPFQDIAILDQAYLNQGQKITLVKVLDRVLVLGVSPQNMQTLHVLDEQESSKYLGASQVGYKETTAHFAESVNVLLSRFKRGDNNHSSANE